MRPTILNCEIGLPEKCLSSSKTDDFSINAQHWFCFSTKGHKSIKSMIIIIISQTLFLLCQTDIRHCGCKQNSVIFAVKSPEPARSEPGP